MANSRTLTVTILGDERDLSRAFNKGAASAKGFGARLGDVKASTLAAAGGVAFLGKELLGVAKDSVAAASDLNEQQAKIGVVFGKSAGEIQAWGKTTASSFGISNRAALEAAGVFGNMLVPMGLARPKAAAMSQALVGLAGDMASFNNADPSQVLEALRSGLAGEAEPLRQFGVFLSADRVQAEALSMGLVKVSVDTEKVGQARVNVEKATAKLAAAEKKHGASSLEARDAQAKLATAESALQKALGGKAAKLTAAQKAQATYNILLKDTKDAQGDVARTSDSLANRERQLGARWEDLQAKLGAKLLPVVNESVGVLLNHGDALGQVAKATAVAAAAYGGYRGTLATATAGEAALSAVQAARARLQGGLQGITLASTAATFGQGKAVTSTAQSFKAFVPTLAETVGKQQAMRAAFVAWSPAATAAAGQTGMLSKAFSALGGAMKATPIGIAVGAIAALTAGYFLLRGGTSATEDRTKRVNAAFAGTERTSRAAAAAIRDQAAATDRLKGAKLDVDQARLNVQEAAARERATRGTKDHTQSVIDLKRARLQERDAARAQADATKGAVTASRDATKAVDAQTAKAMEALHITRDDVIAKGIDADYTKRVARAENELQTKLSASAAAHRRAAANARDQADALDTTTAAGKRAKVALDKIAQTNVGLAGLADLAAAANSARRNVDALLARLTKAQGAGVTDLQAYDGRAQQDASARAPGGGRDKPKGKGNQALGRPKGLAGLLGTQLGPRGNTAAQAQSALTGIGRSSPLAEDQARQKGEANFTGAVTAQGIPAGKEVNADAVRLMGEKAVLAERKKTNTREQGIVTRALTKTRAAIKTKRAAIAANNKARKALKKPGPKAKKSEQDAYNKSLQNLITRGQNLRSDLEGLYGDESNLMAIGADLVAEANQLGFDSSRLEGEIAKTPALVDSVDASSSSDGGGDAGGVDAGTAGLRANVALAELTPGKEDDKAALSALLANRETALAAAIAAGKSDDIIALAGEVKSLRESIDGLTGATDQNTTATEAQTQSFTGTVGFGYRGQSYVVGQSSDNLSNLALGV